MDSVNKWFDAIYTENYGRLIRIAFHSVENWMLAEDLVQNVFLTLLIKVEDLKDHPKLPAWLVVALKYQIMNEQQRAYHSWEVPFLPEYEPSAEDPSRFWEILPSGLNKEERELLYLFFALRLSHEELAKRLGRSPEASRMRLFRAKIHCRDLLLQEKNKK